MSKYNIGIYNILSEIAVQKSIIPVEHAANLTKYMILGIYRNSINMQLIPIDSVS